MVKADVDILRAAWHWKTSARPEEWSRLNRAVGQDDVTALFIHDHVGGMIFQGTIRGFPQLWNLLPMFGVEIDLTACQYGPDAIHDADCPPIPRDREWVLAIPGCERRYEALQKRIEDASFVYGMTSDQWAGPEYEGVEL